MKGRNKRRAEPGSAPGTLSVAGGTSTTLHLMAYGPDRMNERQLASVDEVRHLIGQEPVVWVNVIGLGDEVVLREVAETFGVHPLVLADVVNTNQRSKVEQYDGLQFIVVRMVELDEAVASTQISLVLGEGFLVTFEEAIDDCIDPVRARLRQDGSRIRGAGADYLAYAVIDAVVDNYFPVLEGIAERVEELEEELLDKPGPASAGKIQATKRDLLTLRRSVWPKREALNSLIRDPLPLITEETRLFLRDCYDHTIQVMDMVETHRELVGGLMDLYLTSVSNRMNEVMKVLTIIATIFIPLSFIAGLYGMNFDRSASDLNMPELGWPFGYVSCLALMALVTGGMLLFFWRKGWLGASR